MEGEKRHGRSLASQSFLKYFATRCSVWICSFTVSDHSSPEPTGSFDRTQLLAAMGITAVVLLVASRLWLLFDNVHPLPVQVTPEAIALGLGLGGLISLASETIYRASKTYRASADAYLQMVLQPLRWLDLLWLGFLPGMSEELLFRGVMLPAIGLNWFGILISSLCFGVLHFFGGRYWSYVLWATIIGAALAISAVVSQNLLIPVIAHVTTNILSSALWKWRNTEHP
ncbi:CPBP family intramembrane metalloprotease [filamentous cyanobacterium LEGE 07170]|nr:CPBP family intramembrane metalloprotease [filamentous cyanobacterium LEGE 07170]